MPLLAVFGATGRVGRRVTEYALAAGHTVRALARDPRKLDPRPGLEVLAGDVLDPIAVARTIGDDATGRAHAVISTLGGAGLEDPGLAQSQGMRNICAAMRAAGVRRLLGVAGSGILDHPKGGLRHDQPGFPTLFKPVSTRHMEAWHAMRDSGLDWTMVTTPDIVEGERTGRYRTREHLLPEGATRISVEDVADLLLREMTAGAHVGVRRGAGG